MNESSESDAAGLVCPFGWKVDRKDTSRCRRRCPKGSNLVEQTIQLPGGGTTKQATCKWKERARCKLRRKCVPGRYAGWENGKCRCLKIKNFRPADLCTRQGMRWSWRKWRCVPLAERRRCSKRIKCPYGFALNKERCRCERLDWCPASKTCSYGQYWDKAKCECQNNDWCPRKKTCSYGRYYDASQCACVRQDWCPLTKECCTDGECREDRRYAWDSTKCRCVGKSKCPKSMKWDSSRN